MNQVNQGIDATNLCHFFFFGGGDDGLVVRSYTFELVFIVAFAYSRPRCFQLSGCPEVQLAGGGTSRQSSSCTSYYWWSQRKKVQSSTGCHKIVAKVVVVAQSYNGGHKVVVWRFLEHCDNK